MHTKSQVPMFERVERCRALPNVHIKVTRTNLLPNASSCRPSVPIRMLVTADLHVVLHIKTINRGRSLPAKFPSGK